MIGKVCTLEARLLELEKSSPSIYGHEADEVLQKGSFVIRGPDNVDNFANFSLDVIISELQQYAPDLFSLFMELGETSPEIGAQRGYKEIIATSAPCFLLGARSSRAKGMKLFIGLMLIARSTSPLVKVYLHKDTYTAVRPTLVVLSMLDRCV